MYKEFYGLRANPFNVNPDPRYLFLTRHTEEALACLTYGIQSRKGFVLLTGEVGTGKTTLINKLLEWLRVQQVATAFVFNSRLNVPQFMDYMMADFGIPCDSKEKSQILLRLYNWLLERYRAGENAVLIVDEAQNLSEELLEEIRMLTNLETFTEKLLQIVLVGQPELEQKLKRPQLRQLRQRLTLRAKTHALSLDETQAYVQQRLRIAGSNGQAIFDADALAAIHHYAEGIPRLINLLCEHCLVSAFVDQQKTIGPAVVEAVARDFDLGESAAVEQAAAVGNAGADKFDVVEALRSLATLAERLKQTEEKSPPFEELRAGLLAKDARNGAPGASLIEEDGRKMDPESDEIGARAADEREL
jgi:general secretion pathway protein A